MLFPTFTTDFWGRYCWPNCRISANQSGGIGMKILGAFEPVSLPSFGITNVIAKVDTGAFTGAMHATEISEASHDRRLRFKPLGNDKPVTVTSYYRRVVKSSTGHTEERYCIPVKMKIQGKFYE